MKKVLVITYYWPPASGPSVQRWLKFCKYLPEFGWEPVILTVDNGSYAATDASLLNDVPDGIITEKTKTLEPFKIFNLLRGKKGKTVEIGSGIFTNDKGWFARMATYIRANYFIPDARIGWKRYAIKRARAAIKRHNITHVITTGPPHSAHLIGLALKKELRVKWIADFRDPWTNIFYNQYLPRTKRSLNKDLSLESNVLKTADSVITATYGITQEFTSRCSSIETITNGYDQEDLSSDSTPYTPEEKFTLFFMGNFLASQSIHEVWQAIYNLKIKHSNFSDTFQFKTIGNQTSKLVHDLKKHKIEDVVIIEGFQPHHEAINKMMQSHLLLFPIPQLNGNKLILTGKLFEYLASKIPMLSIGPIDGEAATVLYKTHRSPMIDYKDVEKIQQRIEDQWRYWIDNKEVLRIENELHQIYSRKALTQQLSKILNQE